MKTDPKLKHMVVLLSSVCLFTNNLFSGFQTNVSFHIVVIFWSDSCSGTSVCLVWYYVIVVTESSPCNITSACSAYVHKHVPTSSIPLNCNSLKPGGRGWSFYLTCFHFKTQRDSPGKQKNSTSCLCDFRRVLHRSVTERNKMKTKHWSKSRRQNLCYVFVYCWLANRKSYPSSSRHAAPQLAISATIVSL